MSLTELGLGSRAQVPEHNRLRGVFRTRARPTGATDPHPDKADYSHVHDTAPLGALGYAEVTADQGSITTTTDLTDLAVTVTVRTGRRLRITGWARGYAVSAADAQGDLSVREGATLLASRDSLMGVAGNGMAWGPVLAVVTPAAGEHTYKLTAEQTVGAGGLVMLASATVPAFILVEDIGAA